MLCNRHNAEWPCKLWLTADLSHSEAEATLAQGEKYPWSPGDTRCTEPTFSLPRMPGTRGVPAGFQGLGTINLKQETKPYTTGAFAARLVVGHRSRSACRSCKRTPAARSAMSAHASPQSLRPTQVCSRAGQYTREAACVRSLV